MGGNVDEKEMEDPFGLWARIRSEGRESGEGDGRDGEGRLKGLGERRGQERRGEKKGEERRGEERRR